MKNLHHPGAHLPGNDAASTAQPVLFSNFSQQIIQQTYTEGRFSTADNYRLAVNTWQHFCQAAHCSPEELTATTLVHFQDWLGSKGVCLNTSSCYMRALRALYNKYLRVFPQKECCPTAPFANVFTGVMRTAKRSIDIDVLRRLRNLQLAPNSSIALARDMFLFSFYSMGMPFVDMAHLKRSNLFADKICYLRHKTNQQVSVYMEPCIQDIINRYADSNSPYVFPVLCTEPPAEMRRRYVTQLRRYNTNLQRLSVLIDSEQHISSYVARHTWATTAFVHNVELNVISRALGHTNTSTTLLYIEDLNGARQQQANRIIIDCLK